jgi:hypothetical protein
MARRSKYLVRFSVDFAKPMTLAEMSKLEDYLKDGLRVWGSVNINIKSKMVDSEAEDDTTKGVTKEELLALEKKQSSGK